MKMAFAAVVALFAFAMIFGCLQSTKAPDKIQPLPTQRNDAAGQEYVPNEQVPEDIVVAPEDKPPVESMQKPVAEANPCGDLSGNAKTECALSLAREARDVTKCTLLNAKDDRLKCINNWCMSEARDFLQCDKLGDYDDILACKNKCNPNPNT